jgi:hypothetical protein
VLERAKEFMDWFNSLNGGVDRFAGVTTADLEVQLQKARELRDLALPSKGTNDVGSLFGQSPDVRIKGYEDEIARLQAEIRARTLFNPSTAPVAGSPFNFRGFLDNPPGGKAAPFDLGPTQDQIDASEKLAKSYDKIVLSMRQKIDTAKLERDSVGLTVDEVTKLTNRHDVLQDAVKAGINLDAMSVDGKRTNREALIALADELSAAEIETRKLNEATAAQEKAFGQLAAAAETAINAVMDLTGMGDSPLGNGISGALGSLLKGDWIGALIGGITGLFVGFLEAEKKAREAREALAEASDDIDDFFRESVGESVSEAELAIRAFTERGEQFIALAEAAGDTALVARIRAAIDAYAEMINTVSATPSVEQAEAWVDSRREALRAAYEKEAGALRSLIEAHRRAADTLRSARDAMNFGQQSPLAPLAQFQAAQALYETTRTAALGGDKEALEKLASVSQNYLQTAQGYYANSEMYASIFEGVQQTLDEAADVADLQASLAEQQLAALDQQVSGLIDINTSVLSVVDAIRALQDALGGLGAAGGFDAQSYWSTTLKDFYAALQDYKSTTGSATIPSQIAGVWTAFANATSATQYDQLAAMYAEKLRELTAGYSGASLTSNASLSSASSIMSVPSMRPAAPGNDNAELINEVKALRSEVSALRLVTAEGSERVVGAVEGNGEKMERASREASLAKLRAAS